MSGLIPISSNLFCRHSQGTFTPYRVVLKDERRTSNIQHRTSNNDVASLRNLISFVYYFCLFSALRLRSGPWACRTAVLMLVTKILIRDWSKTRLIDLLGFAPWNQIVLNADRVQPNLPKTRLFVQALINSSVALKYHSLWFSPNIPAAVILNH